MSKPVRDRFDDVPRAAGRVGAHRAENPHMNGWVALLWAVIAAAVLIVGGAFATLILTGRISPFPDLVPTAQATPEVQGVVDTSYSVLILNGTPANGLDAQLRDQVVNAGWSGDDVFAGPSGTTTFGMTTIYYVSEHDELAALGLAEVIGGAEIEQSDHYAAADDPDQKQLTLVIGLDRADDEPEPSSPADE